MLRRTRICATQTLTMRGGSSKNHGWSLPCAALVAACGPFIGLEPLKDRPDAAGAENKPPQYDTTTQDAAPSDSQLTAGAAGKRGQPGAGNGAGNPSELVDSLAPPRSHARRVRAAHRSRYGTVV